MAEEMEISSSDKQVIFPITVGEKASPGTHGGVYCRVTIIKDGNEIVHNIGHDVVLRVDNPSPPRPTIRRPWPPSPRPSRRPGRLKSLSRLEKLREEQARSRGRSSE